MEDKPVENVSKTSDRVEVVHCKDCEYYNPEPYGDVPMCYRGLGYMGEDDFCSLAERRDANA